MKLKTIFSSVFALLCSLTCAAQAPSPTPEPVGPTKPVVVMNTTANPVPVTGTVSGSVSVTNTLNVNAAQSGTWTVGIDGTPTVKLDDGTTVIAKTGSPRLVYSSGGVKPGFGTFQFPGGERIRVYGINRCESTVEFKMATVLIDSGLAGNVFLPPRTFSVGSGEHFTEVFEMLGGTLQLTNSGGSCDNGNIRWFIYSN